MALIHLGIVPMVMMKLNKIIKTPLSLNMFPNSLMKVVNISEWHILLKSPMNGIQLDLDL